jgi:hypothetical protein
LRLPRGIRTRSSASITTWQIACPEPRCTQKLVPVTQILFGTDFTFRTAAEIAQALESCDLSQYTQAINRDNALRLFRDSEREGVMALLLQPPRSLLTGAERGLLYPATRVAFGTVVPPRSKCERAVVLKQEVNGPFHRPGRAARGRPEAPARRRLLHRDIELPGLVHGCVVRSPHAHARIVSIDTGEASRMPGVLAVFTGEDMAADRLGTIRCRVPLKRADGRPMHQSGMFGLARGRARLAGDPVAYVVAETYWQAKDAAEQVRIEYEPLPVLVDSRDAVPGAIAIWEDCPDNVAFVYEAGDKAVDAGLAAAKLTWFASGWSSIASPMQPSRRAAASATGIRARAASRSTAASAGATARRLFANEVFHIPRRNSAWWRATSAARSAPATPQREPGDALGVPTSGPAGALDGREKRVHALRRSRARQRGRRRASPSTNAGNSSPCARGAS